jgi:hypothetical protein
MWMNFYFILCYRPSAEPLSLHILLPALAIALVWTSFLFFYFPIVKGRARRRDN